MQLPAPNTDRFGVTAFLDALVLEAMRRRMGHDLRAQQNIELYEGRQVYQGVADENERISLNRIQNAIITQVDIQTRIEPRIGFVPRESGEPPVYYFNPPAVPNAATARLMSQIDPSAIRGTVGADGLTLPVPLSASDAQIVITAIEAGQKLQAQMSQDAGIPANAANNIVPPTVLVAVNDQSAADGLSTVFDALYAKSHISMYVNENFLMNGIVGWQFMVYEWMGYERRHKVWNPEFCYLYIDPLARDVSDARWVMHDWPLSADQAKAMFPQLAADIEKYARSGLPMFPGTMQYTPNYLYRTTPFATPMVFFRTLWYRDWPYPMSEEEAQSANLVQQPLPAPEPGPGPAQPQVAQVYQLPNGESTQPGSPNWPVKPGIRMIRVLANNVVEDAPCPYPEIPVVLNVNIPLYASPYGQGEPERLAGLQRMIDDVLTDMRTHYDYNSFPVQIVPQSVVDAMPVGARNLYVKPHEKLVVPDDIYTQLGGKISVTQAPPPVNADAWRLLQLLIELHDKEAQHAEVLQGEAASGWSGAAIQHLQDAAKGAIGFKSRRAETMLKQLARLMAFAIVNFMTPGEWAQISSKYPVQVWYAMHERIKRMDLQVEVEITSGSGIQKSQDQDQVLTDFRAGLVSRRTAMKKLGFNPRVELQNMVEEQRELSPPVPPQPAA